MPRQEEVFNAISNERIYQDRKWGTTAAAWRGWLMKAEQENPCRNKVLVLDEHLSTGEKQ
jgi:hypothetical protein